MRNGHSEEDEEDFTMSRSPNSIVQSWFILVNHTNSDFCYQLKGTQVIQKNLELEWLSIIFLMVLSVAHGLQEVAWLQKTHWGPLCLLSGQVLPSAALSVRTPRAHCLRRHDWLICNQHFFLLTCNSN